MQSIRKATHAGSWYSDSASSLSSELDSYLSYAEKSYSNIKVIISPHAGFTYSGPTAAWAYKHIDPSLYSKVFLLGPSHHKYIDGCFLPYSSIYSTPFGPINVDSEIVSQLESTHKFGKLNKKDEEKEHSLEMQLPYIRKIFHEKAFTLVPVMVGEINKKNTKQYAEIFARYLRDPECLFVISSDFCHWGDNFDYQPYDRSKGEIYQYIEFLDRTGMEFIENHDLEGFSDYLSSTGNTICGCNPIQIAISTINLSGLDLRTSFVRYAQSNRVSTPDQFSVSYASSVTYLQNA